MRPLGYAAGLILVFFAGCGGTTTISVDDLPWTMPDLSGVGCPSLDGRYMDKGYLHLNFFVGLSSNSSDRSGDIFPVAVEKYRSPFRSGINTQELRYLDDKFAKDAIVVIKSSEEKIIVTLEDSAGLIYEKYSLRTKGSKMLGCYNGALVLRRKTVFGKGEGSSSTVNFGESELRKRSDGSLEIISRDWYAPTSAMFGLGKVEPRARGVNIFPQVR